jgi:hypothetical protein
MENRQNRFSFFCIKIRERSKTEIINNFKQIIINQDLKKVLPEASLAKVNLCKRGNEVHLQHGKQTKWCQTAEISFSQDRFGFHLSCNVQLFYDGILFLQYGQPKFGNGEPKG